MKKDLITFFGNKILGRIPIDKKDRTIIVLIIIFAVLAITDFFVVDPIPFLDEVLLPALTFILADWYKNHKSIPTDVNSINIEDEAEIIPKQK